MDSLAKLGEIKGSSKVAKRIVKDAEVLFIMKGFTPDSEFRVFEFQGNLRKEGQTEFWVRTDLSLVRKYGIALQELPLLCRGLLEQRDLGEQEATLTFTEEKMRAHASNREANREAAQQKRSVRRHRMTLPV